MERDEASRKQQELVMLGEKQVVKLVLLGDGRARAERGEARSKRSRGAARARAGGCGEAVRVRAGRGRVEKGAVSGERNRAAESGGVRSREAGAGIGGGARDS